MGRAWPRGGREDGSAALDGVPLVAQSLFESPGEEFGIAHNRAGHGDG